MPVNYAVSNRRDKFKGSRKGKLHLNTDNVYLENGDLVVKPVTTGGYDIGHISLNRRIGAHAINQIAAPGRGMC